MYWDSDGNKIDRHEWTNLYAEKKRWQLIRDTSYYRISTVWIGLGDNPNKPVNIFETMVFPKDGTVKHDDYTENFTQRYNTKQQATQGHQKTINRITGVTINIHRPHTQPPNKTALGTIIHQIGIRPN